MIRAVVFQWGGEHPMDFMLGVLVTENIEINQIRRNHKSIYLLAVQTENNEIDNRRAREKVR